MKKAFFRLRTIAIEFPSGVIFGIAELEPIRSGWVVKIKGFTDFEGEDGMEQAIGIASQTTQKIAGWLDGEVELWDVIEVFDREDEATQAGIENQNLAIYHLDTGKLKWL